MRIFILCVLLVPFCRSGTAQVQDHLFGISSSTPGVYAFSRMEISTGNVVQLETMPFTTLSGFWSACLDDNTQQYLLCDGRTFWTLDPYGTAPMTTNVLPLSPTAKFVNVVYNPCDSMLYGLINDPPSSIAFVRYNRALNSFGSIAQLNPTTSLSVGNAPYLDVNSGLYVFDALSALRGLATTDGAMAFNTGLVQIPGETFGHQVLDCRHGTVYGTSAAGGSNGFKYLATVDPTTGVVVHVSSAPTDQFSKLLYGGSCIDQNERIFYWVGVDRNVHGADLENGDFVYHTVGSEQMYLIQHFSSCACSTTSITRPTAIEPFVVETTNGPALRISAPPFAQPATIRVFDMLGRTAFSTQLKAGYNEVDLSFIRAATYGYRIVGLKDGALLQSGLLVVE